MGAGASVESLQSEWGPQILKAKSRQQKLELFQQMTRIVQQSGMAKQDQAAQKLQALQRGKLARNPVKGGMDLKGAFATFSNFGKSAKQKGAGDMIDNSRFRKMLKNAKIVHGKGMKKIKGKMTGNQSDQMHVGLCKKGTKSAKKNLHFDDFLLLAVPAIAEIIKKEPEEVCALICQNGKPKNSGTKAAYNKFYDDKSTRTGVATRGGPSNVDNKITLSTMCDRSDADVRGLGKNNGTKGPEAY